MLRLREAIRSILPVPKLISRTQWLSREELLASFPGVLDVDKACYKLKWYLILYSNGKKNDAGRYWVLGTAWENRIKVGSWKMIKVNDRIIYRLSDENGNAFVSLLNLDENVIAFCDAQRKLLVGDENFSYSLSRKW